MCTFGKHLSCIIPKNFLKKKRFFLSEALSAKEGKRLVWNIVLGIHKLNISKPKQF